MEKDHGRIETRRYWQSQSLDCFADLSKWEGLRSVGVVESVRDIDGQVTTERRCYLSSLPLDIRTHFRRPTPFESGDDASCHRVSTFPEPISTE